LWQRGPAITTPGGFSGEGVVSFEGAGGKREGSIRFDLFELDAKRAQLRRSGVPVDLPPQALKILGILAGRPDELITRKEIQEALWPGQAYGDFDSRLNFAVRKLREGLSDDAEQPRYVQTVRNAGYRFIAPVRELPTISSVLANSVDESIRKEDTGPAESMRGNAVTDSGFRLGRGSFFLVVVTMILVAFAAAAVLALRQGKAGQFAAEAKTPAATTNVEYEPNINSVTAILPQARQRIVIKGRGFGLHVPYVHTDSPYLAIRDLTGGWAAGRMIPQNQDNVTIDVGSWTDTEIVISGFSGEYGKGDWRLAAGDDVEVAIWNPQSGVGPTLYRITVVSANAAR
jgi:DNA-binding winged helix-turn-helix (wHTH) protein